MTRTVALDPSNPEPGLIKEAAAILKMGGVVAYPTETFYALGVSPFDQRGLQRLFIIKGRSREKPVALIVAEPEMIKLVALSPGIEVDKLMGTLWPGPLTIILEARPDLSSLLTGGTSSVGVRVSSCLVARELSQAFGGPITATSANLSGSPSPITGKQVLDFLADKIDLLLDCGLLPGGSPSTVVRIVAGKTVLIREGAVTMDAIERALSTKGH